MIRFILVFIWYFNKKHNHFGEKDYVYDKMINNLYIWLEYFLGVIIKAYKELEDRVGCIENTKGSKSERIERAIDGKLGYFTKSEIRTICPDVGEATINRVFEKLRVEGKIEVVGKGRNSKWKKL